MVVEVLVVRGRGVVDDVEITTQERVGDVAHRCEHPAQLEEATLERQDLGQAVAVRLALQDAILDGVDAIGDLVELREVAVGRRIQQRVEELAGGVDAAVVAGGHAMTHAVEHRRVAPVHAQQPAGADEDVDLGQALWRIGQRFVGDHHVLALVGVHLRPLLLRAKVLQRQRMQRELAAEHIDERLVGPRGAHPDQRPGLIGQAVDLVDAVGRQLLHRAVGLAHEDREEGRGIGHRLAVYGPKFARLR